MIDRLIDGIRTKKNPTVAGLDPTLDMIPEYLKEEYFGEYGMTPEAAGRLFERFNKEIIDEIFDIVPAVKLRRGRQGDLPSGKNEQSQQQ